MVLSSAWLLLFAAADWLPNSDAIAAHAARRWLPSENYLEMAALSLCMVAVLMLAAARSGGRRPPVTVRVAPLLVSIALAAGAWWSAPATSRDPGELIRPLVAPIALPFLWPGLTRASREGRVGEVVARGREILRLLPDWVDGHLFLAQTLAFDAADSDPDRSLDRLLAALAVLENAGEASPSHRAEFSSAQAFLVEVRTARAPEIAERFRSRRGEDPLVAADRYLARAIAASSPREAHVNRAFLAARMVGPALRSGDRPRLDATLERALQLLADAAERYARAGESAAAANAHAHRQALQRLKRYLNGDTGISAASLQADPYLVDITGDLPPR